MRVALVAAILAALAFGHHHSQRPPRPKWLPPLWYRIGVCETGLDWHWHTTDYQGAFGFYFGTWDAYKPRGFPAEADRATPRQQLRVARRVAARVGLSAWGCWTRGDSLGDWVRHG